MRRRSSESEHGFTLIELLIVIIIIGILAAIAIPMFLSQRAKAKDAGVKSGVANIEVGIETWAVDNEDLFPPAAEVSVAGEVGPMVAAWPQDPFNGGDMTNGGDKPGDFAYAVSADGRTYSLVGYISSGNWVVR